MLDFRLFAFRLFGRKFLTFLGFTDLCAFRLFDISRLVGIIRTFLDFYGTFRHFDLSIFRHLSGVKGLFGTFSTFRVFSTFRAKILSKSTFRAFLSTLHLQPQTTFRNHNCFSEVLRGESPGRVDSF